MDVFDVGICGHDPRKGSCPNMKNYRTETGADGEPRLSLALYALAHPNKPVGEWGETWPRHLARTAAEQSGWSSGITTNTEEKRTNVNTRGRKRRTNNMTNSGAKFMSDL